LAESFHRFSQRRIRHFSQDFAAFGIDTGSYDVDGHFQLKNYLRRYRLLYQFL
jgi:hypothetical protein